MYQASTFAEIKNRLESWMQVSPTGGSVTNKGKDLLNRAQEWLSMYRAWSDMIKTATLTLSGTEANLPSDCVRIINIFYDSNGDGHPDGYYFRDNGPDGGYEITDTFSKATGHSRVINFFSALSQTPKITYQYALSDFEDSGTEYSFFPGELLLKAAQRLHIVETGLVGIEMQAIISECDKLLRDYTQSHQNLNNQMRISINDDFGNEIQTSGVNLSGYNDVVNPTNTGITRSMDVR